MAFFDSSVSKLYISHFDLTAFTVSMEPSAKSPLRDVTVLGNTGREFFRGTGEDTMSWSGLYGDGASGSDVVMNALKVATTAKVISVWPGDNTLGDQGFATGDGWPTGSDISTTIGSMVEMSMELDMGLMDRPKSAGPKATKTGNFSGTSIDGGASSSSGGTWVYHIFAFSASGGNARWKIILQDSADDSAWATVGSQTVNIAELTSARIAFTGTVRRYVRVRAELDASSGSLTYHAGFEIL